MCRRAGASQTDPSASRGSSRVPPLVWCWEPLTCPCLKTGAKGRGGSVGGEDRHADRPDVGLVVPRGGWEVLCRRGAWGLVVHSADAVRPVGLSCLVKSFARSLNSWFIFFFERSL